MVVLAIFLFAAGLLFLGFEMLLVLGLPGVMIKEIYFSGLPDIVLGQKIVGGINQSTLLAIPFFIFAAELMASGRIARDLTNLVKTFLGHRAGGIGHTTIAACAAFGSVSGSAPATVAALGRIMYPELVAAGYRERFSLGLIVSAAETALLIPPSITLIIYGWLTGTSITGLFAGGLVIGIFLALAFSAYVVIDSIRHGRRGSAPIPWGERLRILRSGSWALGLPIIILGGIYGGIFTATEAAAVSVIYAMFVEAVVFRELTLKGLFRVAAQAAVTNSVIFILLGMGSIVSYFITLAQFPAMVIDFMAAIHANWVVFLIVVNVLFLIAGMFIDPNSALLVLVPAFFPVALSFGIDPIHFGLIVCLNICIGMITPPFGLDIFVASSTLNKPVATIIGGVWPFIAINLLTLIVVTYVPQLSTFFPNLIVR